ncbi:MAG: winged helix-turn-helix domain-containing protein [Thermoanaerobaculia bacterium]
MSDVVSPPMRFGTFTFNPETGELAKNGHRIALRPQAAQILAYLAWHPNQMVTREDLRGKLWSTTTFVDSDHGLNLCIHEIRNALHDDAENPKFIETLPRRGYRFIGAIQTPPGPGSETRNIAGPELPEPPETTLENPPWLRWLRLAAVAGSAALLATILIASARTGVRETNASPPPAPQIVATIALLPLGDPAARPEGDYFASGVTWELQRQLEGMHGLRVISLWSVLHSREENKSTAEMTSALGVSHLVSGSVLNEGDRVVLRLKIVDAGSGIALWARRYDTTLAGLPQSEIDAARAIAQTLAGTTAAVLREPAGQAQVNAEAHSILLKAMGAENSEDYQKGLERAAAVDPQFGLAWSLLADSYLSDTWFDQKMPPVVGYPKAKEYALRALAIDDSDSSAHTTVAAVKLHYEWDWPAAEREFRRAIELSPNDAWAHHIYSHYLLTMDRLSESVAESRIASDLDPLNPTLSTCVGWHCLFARQYEDAIAECLKLVNDKKAGPVTYYYLGRVYVRQGKLAEGIAALEIADKKAGGLNAVLATLAYAYGRADRQSDALRALAVLKERAKTRYVAAFDIAIVYAGLGDSDATFEWLDRAFLERSTWLVHIKWDDRFATVRDDPRFVSLLARMGIPNPNSVQEPETPVRERFSPVAAAL